MTLDSLLIVLSIALAPFAILSTVILVEEARKPPRIGALTERAVIAVVIAIMVVSGTLLTINRVNGFALFPVEAARAIFLMSLISLEFVPVGWLALLVTHRLGDGGSGE